MILVDTHVIFWFMTGNSALPDSVKEKVFNDEERYISIATFWEMTIKSNIGKLTLPGSISDMIDICSGHGFKILNIDGNDLECLHTLELIHRDPFDRILISQALSKNMTLLTADENIMKYNVETFWEKV